MTKTTLPIERTGPPGIPSNYHVVDIFHNETRVDQERLADSLARKFVITGLLGKSPFSTEGINLSVDTEVGASFISAHPNAVKTIIRGPEGTLELRHNSKRELASAHYECVSTSSNNARVKFLEAISPFLDHISYLGNVPIHLNIIECHDEKNNIRAYNCINPHAQVVINPHEGNLQAALLPIYALYREAKNGHSLFYRFLCYFKIMEGIYTHLRPKTFSKAKKLGLVLTKIKEVLPEHDELRGTHQNLIGKPIKEIFDTRFTPEFRHHVAHYVLSNGEIMNVSDQKANDRFGGELLAIEMCARILIATQEKYEEQVAGRA